MWKWNSQAKNKESFIIKSFIHQMKFFVANRWRFFFQLSFSVKTTKKIFPKNKVFPKFPKKMHGPMGKSNGNNNSIQSKMDAACLFMKIHFHFQEWNSMTRVRKCSYACVCLCDVLKNVSFTLNAEEITAPLRIIAWIFATGRKLSILAGPPAPSTTVLFRE